MVFNEPENKIERFKMITSFLCDYQQHIRILAEILTTIVPELLPNVHVIPCALAYKDPHKYIGTVAEMVGLDISDKQRVDAIDNIDPSLYRCRLEKFADELKEWDLKIGATVVYNELVGQDYPWHFIGCAPIVL